MTSTKPEKALDEIEKNEQNESVSLDQPPCKMLCDKLSHPLKRLVLLFTGSFNPVTIAHLRMLELARDYYHLRSVQVLEGIISPVSNSYGKPGLAEVNYRIEMLRAAIRNDHWLRVDTWEAEQASWTRTKIVLDHHYENIKKQYGENTELRLLAGTDVVCSMLNPNVWLPKDIDDIMTNYGVACITRSNAPRSDQKSSTLQDITEGMPDLWKEHVDIVQDWVINDISATKIRDRLENGCSIKYIVPDATISIIRQYGLYNSNKSMCLADWQGEKKEE